MSFYTQDLSGCLDSAIGANGLNATELQVVNAEADEALTRLRHAINAGKLPFANPQDGADQLTRCVEETYSRLAENARTIMFFGCGAAGLIGQAIAQYAGWGIPGVMVGAQRRRPVTRFYSNPDPVTMAGALARSDIDKTRFVFISKTGDVSTVCQALAAIEAVRQSGNDTSIPKLFLTITGTQQAAASNGLQRLSEQLGIPRIAFPEDIDERFSALTIAGLLPAVARGLDVREVLEGANSVSVTARAAKGVDTCDVAQAAAVSMGLARYRGCNQKIFMPFDDRLAEFAGLWAHLVSSEGGNGDNYRTAMACARPLDQQSFLQNLPDQGPAKYLTLIQTAPAEPGPAFSPDLVKTAGIEGLANGSLDKWAAAQQTTVEKIVREKQLPARILKLPHLDAGNLGSLMMQMMLELVLTSTMLKRDPFRSPQTEQFDQRTIQALRNILD